jgi:F0F1-type ATP synthase membrane subunit b/b'
MTKEFITISEAIALCKVSESTVRRWIIKYKNNNKIVQKDNGIYTIKAELFFQDYPVINDYSSDQHKQSREIAELTLEKQNQDIIKELVDQRNDSKPFSESSVVWVTTGFVVLIVVLGVLGWFYRKELINTYNSKITEITTFKDEIIKDKESNLQDVKKELKEIRTAYQQTLKAVDLLHIRYNDKLYSKEKQYQLKLDEEKNKIKGLEGGVAAKPRNF